MANPYNSPHRQSRWINNIFVHSRWKNIRRHLPQDQWHDLREQNGMLKIDDVFYIAQHSQRMRLKSHLDWVYYTPRDLAQAMIDDDVPAYYERQMQHAKSPSNRWRRSQEEQELKTRYAHRAGRADWIPPKKVDKTP